MEYQMPAHIKRLILSATAVGLLVAPIFASAQDRVQPVKIPTGFCLRAANVKIEFNSRLTELEKQGAEKKTEILDKLKERKDDQTAEVKQKREEADNKLETALDEVEATATTAQKAALVTFKATVKRAQATRKAAVDSAVSTYRTGLQALVTKRQEAIRAAAARFKSSIAAANAKAQADCTAGMDQVTVRQTLRTSIQAAQDKFKTDVKAVDTIGSQVKDLVTARNKAMEAAKAAFKATVLQAKATLKAALGTTTSPRPEPTE